uniref:EamA domain-containing protein n=1 Tax=Dunaliella tertiolecta TaxID=3047 RepID=A0A7S3VKJ8_DUNTE|mmetsp:Transcript_2951/g.6831  ORF Transcript_2951/g.6831 Transcript_2951/m.6831 type:complete len:415 (-) Transcript_2951:128-1372(-)
MHVRKAYPILTIPPCHSTGIPLACGFPSKAVLPSPIALLLLLGISASSFWGQLLIGRGLQLLSAAQAGAINITQVLYSYVFGVVILNEHLSWLSLIGSVFIASGVVCVSSKPKAKPSQEYARLSTTEETIAQGGPHFQPAQHSTSELEMGTDPRAQEAPSTGKGIQGGAEAEGGTESSKDVKQGGQEAQLATSEVAKAGMGATTDGAAYLAALPHHQNGHHQNGHHLQENGHYHPLQQASEGAGEQIGGSEQLPLHIEGGVLVPPGGHRAEQEGHLPPPHACINVDALPAQPLPLPVSFGSANSSWGQPLQQLEGQAPSGVMGDSWQGSSIHHQSLGQAGSQGGEQQQEVGVHEHEGGTQGLDSSDQWYGYLLGPVEGHDAGLLSLQQAQADESFQEAGRVTSEEMGHDKSGTS